ncbi:unnamed protein product [Umbelopsis sp. WA50703]
MSVPAHSDVTADVDVMAEADSDLELDLALEEEVFSGDSDYYQPSEDEDAELDQDFLDMELEEEVEDAINDSQEDEDDDEGERNERELNAIMAAATSSGLEDMGDTGDLNDIWAAGDEDLAEFEENLAKTAGIGKAKRRKGKGRGRKGPREHPLTPEIKAMLGDANQHYVNAEYAEAIKLYQDIITQDHHVHSAWVNLGMIQEELGRPDKALLFKMVAACIQPKDIDMWKSAASASIELGARHQAIFCLRKVLSLDPTDKDALWDRSFLLKEDGKIDAAIRGFNELLSMTPHHVKVIDELAKLYRSKENMDKAIELYEQAMDYHFERDDMSDDDNDENKFRYTEINMLTELYIMVGEYEKALMCIKYGVMYLQRRIDDIDWQTGLDPADEDAEFDPNTDDPEAVDFASFPVELRARMAVCRIHLDYIDVAKKHTEYVARYPAKQYSDLYHEIAAAYMEKAKHDLALELLQKIIDEEEAVDVDVLIRSGDCYREVGELETAIEFYTAVLEEQDQNLDVMMALAQVYEEIGEEEKAFDLVTHVMRLNRETRRLQDLENNNAMPAMSPTHDVTGVGSIFDEIGISDQARMAQSRIRHDRKARERQIEEEKTETTKRSFASLHEFKKRMEASNGTDSQAAAYYMEEARSLWEDFSHVKALYPSDKSKKFTGFRSKRLSGRHETDADIESELHKMVNRLASTIKRKDSAEDREALELLQEEQKELEERYRRIAGESSFRGISFGEWLQSFINYCFLLTNSGQASKAYELLNQLGDANVFYHDPQRRLGIKLTMIACALLADDHPTVYEVTRTISTIYQYQDDGYKLYTALLSNGSANIPWYSPAMTVKYLIRQVKTMDRLIRRAFKSRVDADENEDTQNAALHKFFEGTADDEETDNGPRPRGVPREKFPKKPIISLLLLLGNVLQIARNQTAAIVYYCRAYSLCPHEPLIALLTGVAFLNRAVQRITDNRHLQIVQAFTFLFKYYESRKELRYAQEAEYNIARAFHTLDLGHLAVPYYERALCLPSRMIVVQEGDEASMRGHSVEQLLEDVYDWEVPHPWSGDEDDPTDLRQEAAYNLHMIYVTSGNPGLAQMLMIKYCSV